MKKLNYFAYGSNMSSKRLRARVPSPDAHRSLGRTSSSRRRDCALSYPVDVLLPLRYKSNCFNFEFFGVSLVAHIHLSDSHFVWLKGV